MNYAEAIKKVRAEKPKDNFMVLEFSYDNRLLLPHKDGVAVLAALANAERLVERYGDKPRIDGLERESVKSYAFAGADYELFKVATLLDMKPEEVKEIMRLANNPPSTTS